MIESIDRVLIFLTCTFLFSIHYTNYYTVALVMTALILCSLNFYFENKWIHFALFFLYMILCSFFGGLLYFLPCMLYDPIRYPYRYVSFLMVVPLVRFGKDYSLTILLLIAMFTCISAYLSLRTLQWNKLRFDYNTMRDTSYELSLIAEEKNRHVLENQDYEINLAMLNERNRISKEIHDNIGHLLSRSLLQIGALLTITKEDATKEVLTDLRDSISEGMNSIRASIHNMHDESIDLYSSLYTLVKDFTFCKIHLDYDVESDVPIKLKYCFISTIKESLNNIVKHSNATSVSVVLREHPGLYQLIISDNGTFTKAERYRISQQLNQLASNDGMGLQNIVDRVKGFYGTLRFNLDEGFQTYITIPKTTVSTDEKTN